MPTEPYKAYPTVEPAATPPYDYFHLEASPERFAAGAKGLEQAGKEVSSAADLWGQLQVDAQANSTLKAGDDLLNQLRSLHGQEQIDFANGLPERLNQVVTQGGQGLSPVQRNRFENIVRPYQYRLWNGEATTSAARAAGEVAHQTYENTVTEAGDRAARFSNNPDGDDFKHAVADSIYAYQQLERFKGNANLPGTMEYAERQGTSYAYTRAVEAIGVRDPVAALKLADDNKDKLGAEVYDKLAKEFHNKAEVMQSEQRGDIVQKGNMIADKVARDGFFRAHGNELGPELLKSLTEGPQATQPPAQKATPSDFVKQQIQQETQKPPGQPAQQPAQPSPQKPGQGATIEVPLDGHIAMLSITRAGRAQLIEEGIKQYPPLTTINVSGRKFTIPAAGTTFEIEGIKHTVPAAKAAAPAQTAPATPTPATPATTPAAAVPQKQGQNFSPAPNQKTGQALPFGEEQSKNYSPAQMAIAKAIDSRTPKDLNVRQLPGNVLETARDVALHSGPTALQKFMSDNGHPKSGNWCGEFAAAVVRSAGGMPPKNPEIASNWRGWGQPTAEPKAGDIAVRRGTPTGQTGSHVTFVEDYNPRAGTFTAIGGNQNHARSTFRIADFDFRTGMPEREARQ